MEIAAFPEVIIDGVTGRQKGGEFMLGVIGDFVGQNRVLKLPGKHRKVQPLYAIIYAILNSMQIFTL